MTKSLGRDNAVGVTALAVSPAVSPAVIPAVIPRQRVIIDRPAPPPVRRCCPYCCAVFDDHTRRSNTIYCRPSCRVAMSKLKKRTAITLWARISNAPEFPVSIAVESLGLVKTEKMLGKFGYTFQIAVKAWVKQGEVT